MGADQSTGGCLPSAGSGSTAPPSVRAAKKKKMALKAQADGRAKQWQRAIQFKPGTAEASLYSGTGAAGGLQGKKKKSAMKPESYSTGDDGEFVVVPDGKFMDEEFPPNAESLAGAGGDGVGWMRLSDMYDDEAMFKDSQGNPATDGSGIDPDDICQGYLGDCWLLSSIACLAEFPDAVYDLFITKEVTEDGMYTLKLFDPEAGEWAEVTIDDYVPCSIGGDSPLFTSANSGEMWVPLLEKAVAKMFGSYAAIEGGYSFYAFQILTGDAVQSAQVGDDGWDMVSWTYDRAADECGGEMVESISSDDMFEKLWQADQNKWIMGAGTDGVDESTAEGGINEGGGLVDGHAYSVIAVYKNDDIDAKIVRIRNPWGKFEWDGAYSDTDTDSWGPLLEAATDEDKATFFTETDESMPNYGQINAGVQLDDGTFWMSWEDFSSKFGSLDIGENDGEGGQ